MIELRSGEKPYMAAVAWACTRLLLSEVRVNDREIRISGSKAVLARSAAGGVAKTTPAVLSFVREWRARNDSNVRPSDS